MDALFPGQGSQSVGMGRVFYDEFREAREVFEEASDALGLDIKKLCFEGPDDQLALTYNTQPALLTVSIAMLRSLSHHFAIQPERMAGHSLGEYAALVAGGVLNFSDAVRAVRIRGEAMQSAVPVGSGAMVAILGLSDEDAIRTCQWAIKTSGLSPLEPANFNSPGQVVVSGTAAAVEWLRTHFSSEHAGVGGKAKFIPLHVSAPFHCSMMEPARKTMERLLNETHFSPAHADIVQNVTAKESRDPNILRKNLVDQVTAPVRWTSCILRMKELGSRRMIEMGPGKVLAGLVKKIDSHELSTLNIQTLDDIRSLSKDVKA